MQSFFCKCKQFLKEGYFIERGFELKELRTKLGLKQVQVASVFGFSRSYLYQIESGKRKCPDDLYKELIEYYNTMNQTEGLEAIFDYVRVRIPSHDVERVIEDVLLMNFESFYEKPTGLFGYFTMYEYDNIRVLLSKKGDDRGILIELSGQGCRNYEYILNELDQQWLDFFGRCLFVDGVVKRIDVAVNDYVEYFSLEEVAKKRKAKLFDSSFRKSRVIDSTNDKEVASEGITAYFGTRNSLIYFCFYQKNYEIANRERIPVEEVDVKNRYEIRLHSEKAHKFIEYYMEDTFLLRSVRSVISQQLCFFEKDRKGGLKIWSKWERFLGATKYVDLSMKVVKPSFYRKLNWLAYSCLQTIKVVQLGGEQEGFDYLGKMLNDVELNEKNKKVLEWHLAENMEVLSDNGRLIAKETGEIIC
ncbi:replication initiation factor domain-containing protein [Enterococcus faecalis]|uniref:replication initiation factor domain-containing protein n=1 Tax=Enterococcus faecalis TaxID=1351 RepID=UPI00192520DF|nr:replication initiation factor domain-containing protein [Enterococcus faecalis]MDG4628250.1 replication initiation factor domain-containing protein [Enterococcus faecalis]MDG4631206.1 replication initiation factor domain-containing protein [Enterococcus faecalis]MDU7906711.1 replication initiation factor domain-containing protein [Enterococcus faecalis]MDU8024859.1 replication initiation factor domain-containing protein [Enterococcus faecalis]